MLIYSASCSRSWGCFIPRSTFQAQTQKMTLNFMIFKHSNIQSLLGGSKHLKAEWHLWSHLRLPANLGPSSCCQDLQTCEGLPRLCILIRLLLDKPDTIPDLFRNIATQHIRITLKHLSISWGYSELQELSSKDVDTFGLYSVKTLLHTHWLVLTGTGSWSRNGFVCKYKGPHVDPHPAEVTLYEVSLRPLLYLYLQFSVSLLSSFQILFSLGTSEGTFLLICSHCKCSEGTQGADSFLQFDIEISSLKAHHQCS